MADLSAGSHVARALCLAHACTSRPAPGRRHKGLRQQGRADREKLLRRRGLKPPPPLACTHTAACTYPPPPPESSPGAFAPRQPPLPTPLSPSELDRGKTPPKKPPTTWRLVLLGLHRGLPRRGCKVGRAGGGLHFSSPASPLCPRAPATASPGLGPAPPRPGLFATLKRRLHRASCCPAPPCPCGTRRVVVGGTT